MADPNSSARSTFLMFLLLGLLVAGFLLVCVGFLGQFAFAALAVLAMVSGIGLCHYLLWGKSLSQEVEAERGREIAEDEITPDSNGWPTDGPRGPRRF